MTSSKPIRICADCRHCTSRREFFLIPTEFCAHPRAVDIVTGRAWQRCVDLRHPKSRLCGERGRLWEAVNVIEPYRGTGAEVADAREIPGVKALDADVTGIPFKTTVKIIDRMKPR